MAQRHSSEVKAAALAALMEGQAVSRVAADHHIPEGTVKKWRVQLKNGEAGPDNPTQKREIGDLLVKLLETNLETLIVISTTVRDPRWLKRQSASEVGVLLGVLDDKVNRSLSLLTGGMQS